MKIFENISALTGRTPLMSLENYRREINAKGKIIAKLEYLNPAGSVKDRVGKAMLDDAEQKGILKKNSVIIEPTSGNTGIGICSIAAARGYKAVIVMPDTMSIERIKLMKAYGAQVVLSDGKFGMSGAIKLAEELHKNTTGVEIFNDTDGEVDIFVAGVGTGGTITGVGEYLKSKNPDIKIIAVEPEASPVLSENKAGAHKIQGIGAGFVPEILNTKVYDEVVKVKCDDAYSFAREIAKCEGVLVGISSGAALCAAVKIAKREEYNNKTIVVLLPDTGERYLSTDLYSE